MAGTGFNYAPTIADRTRVGVELAVSAGVAGASINASIGEAQRMRLSHNWGRDANFSTWECNRALVGGLGQTGIKPWIVLGFSNSPKSTIPSKQHTDTYTPSMDENGPPSRYLYDPSLAAAVIFAVLFGLSTVAHAFQLVRGRTWSFIAFLIGSICRLFTPLFCHLTISLALEHS